MKAIDLFAGLGGFSQAAKLAGVQVIWAANHWQPAVDTHARNHPETVHACQDLRQADFTALPDFDMLLASPCCQGFSKARGKDSPQHDSSRSTCFAVVDAMLAKRPSVIIVENVEDIRSWGPDKNGAHYRRWLGFFEDEGYHVSQNVTDAVNYGIPQERKRIFLLMVHHSIRNSPVVLPQAKGPRVAAHTVIEWGNYQFSWIKDKCDETRRKIDYSRERLGLSTFLLPYYGRSYLGRSLNEPLGTVRAGDCWALIHGDRMRMLQPTELRKAMGFPDHYILPSKRRDAVKALGNAVCPPQAKHPIEAGVALLK